MNNSIRKKNGVRISPIFYDNSFWKKGFYIAMLSAFVVLLFTFKMTYYCGQNEGSKISYGDWIGLGLGLFLFGMFLLLSFAVYASNIFMKIIDTIIEDDEPAEEKQKYH